MGRWVRSFFFFFAFLLFPLPTSLPFSLDFLTFSYPPIPLSVHSTHRVLPPYMAGVTSSKSGLKQHIMQIRGPDQSEYFQDLNSMQWFLRDRFQTS